MKYLYGMLIVLLVSCGDTHEVYKVIGPKGDDGVSCYAETRTDGNFIVCGDSEFKVADGEDGQDGSFDGYLEYVEVCPDIKSHYDMKETLLYLDGQYLAFLSDENYKRQRLVVLEDGVYKTTDGRDVTFSISGEELNCSR